MIVTALFGSATSGLDELAQKHSLTDRERELVGLTVRGLQNSEIALLADISAHTVRNTLAKVFEKVGVTNRSELTYLASRPSGELRDGKASIVPPRSRLPGDGLPTFIARVEGASSSVRARSASEPPVTRPRTRIVYTAPLTPTNA